MLNHHIATVLIVLSSTAAACVTPSTPTATATLWTKATQASLSPDEAISRLKDGHARFRTRQHSRLDYAAQVRASAGGQYPMASVLSCIDSRAPVEALFDVGIGEIFSARVAGVVVDDDIIGSLEYTVKYAGSKAIVVMAHTRCGAVKGAIDNVKDGHIGTLVAKLEPAVRATNVGGEHSSHNHELVDAVARAQVVTAIGQLRSRSAIIRELADQGAIRVIGALYHVESGEIEFTDDAPHLASAAH